MFSQLLLILLGCAIVQPLPLGTIPEKVLAKRTESIGYVEIPFTVQKRDEYHAASGLQNVHNLYYLIDLEIGNYKKIPSVSNVEGIDFSGSQKVQVMLDTGSSDIIVEGIGNSFCSSTTQSSGVAQLMENDGISLARRYTEEVPSLEKRKNVFSVEDLWSQVSSGVSNLKTEIKSKFSSKLTNSALASSVSASTQYKAVSSTPSSSQVSCFNNGFYAGALSSTFSKNSSSNFTISYGDGTYFKGYYAQDDAKIGDILTIKDMNFGVVTEGNSTVGVFGIGLKDLETNVMNNKETSYDNFAYQVANQYGIKTVSYAISLGSTVNTTDKNYNNGSILFGAVDEGKYEGSFATLPIQNYQSTPGFYVSVDSVSLIYNGNSTTSSYMSSSRSNSSKGTNLSSNKYVGLLDAGNSLSGIPSDMYSNFASLVSGKQSSSGLMVDCSVADNKENKFIYSFVSESDETLQIEVPFPELKVETVNLSNGKCLLGMYDNGAYIDMGDAFFRSSYLVFNLDDKKISIAKPKENPTVGPYKVISSSS